MHLTAVYLALFDGKLAQRQLRINGAWENTRDAEAVDFSAASASAFTYNRWESTHQLRLQLNFPVYELFHSL